MRKIEQILEDIVTELKRSNNLQEKMLKQNLLLGSLAATSNNITSPYIGGQNPVNTTMNRNNYAEISEKKS